MREGESERDRGRESKLNTLLVLPVLCICSVSIARPVSLGREGLSVNANTC